MDVETQPILLEQRVRFDTRRPVAVPLDTAFSGQVLLIGMRAGQQLRDHRVATPITIQVIRGLGEITTGTAACPAQPGVFLSLAAGVVHGASAETDLVLLVHRAAAVEAAVLESAAPPLFAEIDPVTLDMRDLAPRDRHACILAIFDALRPGEALCLINDHDPKPLKYQFAADHAGEATWEPEQSGPETWIVRIGKIASMA